MATGDITARNSRASDFASDYTTATLTLLDGSSTLVAHTLAGFATPTAGAITANAIADSTILIDGTPDSATLTDTAGAYTLTVGTSGSGADVIISTETFLAGETSSVNSLTVSFP